jgi:acyl-CoA synthetase (NDP forming)
LSQELLAKEISSAFESQDPARRKTLLNVVMYGSEAEECRRLLEERGLPTFEYPDLLVKVLSNMVQYSNFRSVDSVAN